MSGVISIVGGGWSMLRVDHRKIPGDVIAVNDSVLHLKRQIDNVVSMDRLWTEGRWATLLFRRVKTYVRRSSLKNIPVDEWAQGEWLHPFECDRFTTKFSETVEALNGRNSGACAMNLAYVLRPRQLFLFGFDMRPSPNNIDYWYPKYEWKGKPTGQAAYSEWARDFKAYADQFKEIGTKVVNVSPTSMITAFERVSPEEVQCQKDT